MAMTFPISEISAELNMILARLEAPPKTAREWEVIVASLRRCLTEAKRQVRINPIG